MKKITFLIVLISCVSVGQQKKKRWSDTYVVKEKPVIPIEEIEPFVGENQFIVTYTAGDFNEDSLTDAVVVLSDKKEIDLQRKKKMPEGEIKRPLLILQRNSQGSLVKVHENNSIVFCYMCDSPNGSPLTSVVFDGNTFAVEHEAGKANRWTRIISFEFDREKEIWWLKKDAVSQYNIMNKKGIEATIKTQEDFGFIRFDQVDVYQDNLMKD